MIKNNIASKGYFALSYIGRYLRGSANSKKPELTDMRKVSFCASHDDYYE